MMSVSRQEQIAQVLKQSVNTGKYSDVFDKFVKYPLSKEHEEAFYLIFKEAVSEEQADLFKLHRYVIYFDKDNKNQELEKIQRVLFRINKRNSENDEFWGDLSESIAPYPYGEMIIHHFAYIQVYEKDRGEDILEATLKLLQNPMQKNEKTLLNHVLGELKFPKENESDLWRKIFKELTVCRLNPSQEKMILLALSELEKEGTLTTDSVNRAWLIRLIIRIDQWRSDHSFDHAKELLSTFMKRYQNFKWEVIFEKILQKSEMLSLEQIKDLLIIFGGFQHKNPLYLFICKKYSDKGISEKLFDQWVKPLPIQNKVIESPLELIEKWKTVNREWALRKIANEDSPLTVMLTDFMAKKDISIDKIIKTEAFQKEYELHLKTPQAASGAVGVIKRYCNFYFRGLCAFRTLSLKNGDVKWIRVENSDLVQPQFTVLTGQDQKPSLFIVSKSVYLKFNQYPKAVVISFSPLEGKMATFEAFKKTLCFPQGWKSLDQQLLQCFNDVKEVFFPNQVETTIFLKLFHTRVTLFLMELTKARTFAFLGDDSTYSIYLNKIINILFDKKQSKRKEKDDVLDFLDNVEVQKRMKAHKEIFRVKGMRHPKMRLEES